MASYPPPNQNVAIFNPLNFVSGGEGLTLDEGKKFFLQFPDAQGTENMETTNIDGVFTANDQAFFNDTITLEQTATGEDALNILVDSPGYAIRATTRTDPTTNTQITILPTATSGEINSIVQLGDALIYSTTGDLTGGSMAITALGAVDEFGIRLNETDEAVEIGGQLELLNKGIKFSDGTIQSTAYTGDGSETLEDVLTTGNDAGGLTITNLTSIEGTTYFMGDAGVDTLLTNGTGGAFDFLAGDGGGLTQLILKVQQSGVSLYNDLKLVGATTNIEFSDGTIQTTAYTGDGTDTLGDVLNNGNIASQDIYMNGNNLTDVNFLQFGTAPGLLVGEEDNTLYVSTLGTTTSVNNIITYDPATGKLLYQPTPFASGSVSLGQNASSGTPATNRVHIGNASGGNSGGGSIGIGTNSGINQGTQSVAIGIGAGFNLGFNSVAIGANAGGTASGSICLNATGLGLNPSTSGLYIEPLRDLIPAVSAYKVYYDTGTKEMFYNTTESGVSTIGSNSALAVSVYLPNDPANIVRQNLVNVDFDNTAFTPAGSQTIIQCRYTLNVVGTNGIIVAYSSGNFSFCPFRMANSNPFGFSKQPLNDPGVSIPTYTGITAWNTSVGAVNPVYDELAYLSFEWDSASPLFFTLYTIKDPAVLSQNTQYTFNLEILNCGGSVYNLPAPAPANWNTNITTNVSTIVPYTPP